MRKGKVALSILCLIVTFLACNKDDGGNTITPVEDRDRNEQQMADKDSIVQYLNGHYYNASAFDNNPNASIADLIITKLPDNGVLPDPTNNEILMDAVELKSVVYANTDYEFYILNLNPGGGEAPNFADQVRVKYEGFTLDNEVFDSAVTPIDFDLLSLVPGWRKAIPFFNTAVSFVDNGDGTVDYTNHGVGVMFIPSGLGYFSNPTQTIPAYSPLVFKFDLFETSLADHDSDGVPSYLEDLNGDGEVVGGIVIMRYGENAQQTIAAVKDKLKQLENSLPEGVEVVTVYDRSELIDNAVENLWHKLAEELLVVGLICLLFGPIQVVCDLKFEPCVTYIGYMQG